VRVLYWPYINKYTKVDMFYGDATNAAFVPWARSQTQVNVAEVAMQLLAAALSSASIGTVFGLIVSTSTFIKTVLYMLMIANNPDPTTALPCLKLATPEDAWNFWVLFVLTNGWCVRPLPWPAAWVHARSSPSTLAGGLSSPASSCGRCRDASLRQRSTRKRV